MSDRIVKVDMKNVAQDTIDEFKYKLRKNMGDILSEAIDPANRDSLLDYLEYRMSHSINSMEQYVMDIVESHVRDDIQYRTS